MCKRSFSTFPPLPHWNTSKLCICVRNPGKNYQKIIFIQLPPDVSYSTQARNCFSKLSVSTAVADCAVFPSQFKHQMTWEHAVWLSWSLKVKFCDIKPVCETLFSLSVLLFTHISIWIMMCLWLKWKEIHWMSSKNVMAELSWPRPAKSDVLWFEKLLVQLYFRFFFFWQWNRTSTVRSLHFVATSHRKWNRAAQVFTFCLGPFFLLFAVFFILPGLFHIICYFLLFTGRLQKMHCKVRL